MGRLESFENPFVWDPDHDPPRYLAQLRRPGDGVTLVGDPRLEVCRRCGFLEISVVDAAQVPWSATETASDVEEAAQACERCGGGRTVRLSQVFPGFEALRLAWTDTSRLFRSASPVGHVVGAVCPDCGLLTLRLAAPRELPWDRLVGFNRTPRPCPECGEHLGRLEHAGDPTATVATARTDHLWTEGVGHAAAWACPGCGWIGLEVPDHASIRWDRVLGWSPLPIQETAPDPVARPPRTRRGARLTVLAAIALGALVTVPWCVRIRIG
jgi:predicted RNA-binding Zn-ribbon protein involved in translation (DUF1610 family)